MESTNYKSKLFVSCILFHHVIPGTVTGELRRPTVKKEHVSERLPSFRGKRDLTLGGVAKVSGWG